MAHPLSSAHFLPATLAVLCAALVGPACDSHDAVHDAAPAADTALPDGAQADAALLPADPPLVAEGIALCYQALHGDVTVRQQALDTLKQATLEHPDHARAFLFFGMCSLSALVEDGTFAAFADVEPSLARAYELAPDDHRIAGWIGTVKVATARITGAGLDEAIAAMIAAADLYPEFNNVSLAIAFSPSFGLDTPYPRMAIDRLEAIGDCGLIDARCRNNPAAPHNLSGSLMLFGDVYARVGERDRALGYYSQALVADGADSWPYRAEAQAAVDELDERLARFTDGDPMNDPTFFATGPASCRGCHE